jgi:DNA-binding GntR family transcriptional regulator
VDLAGDRAHLAIRNLIVSLELAPGALIQEPVLMEMLGFGRTPVCAEMSSVARISEVREALEPEAARLAAERATEDERDELLDLGDQIKRGADLMALDERIHRAIYKAAHNDLMEKTLGEYYVLALRIWMIALNRDEALEDAVEAHRPLLIDIAQGNADKAADRMRAHVQDFEKAMHRVLVTV